MTIPPFPRLALAAALVVGTAAWVAFLQQDLVLSHYDAKAHLVVARRVIDNMTPGWKQVGAVWLPLPHLIQLLPTQIDLLYRTGAFGSLLSIAAFGVTAWAAAHLVLAMTGSTLGALTAAALLLLNPNLLYLQATPMTEPLLLAVTFAAVMWLLEWVVHVPDGAAVPPPPRKLGCVLFAAMWTRYEAWPIVAAAMAAAAYALWRRGATPPVLLRRIGALAAWPLAAVAIFVVNSRATSGSWFITGGFYVPDPAYDGQAWRSVVAVWWGTHRLAGYAVEAIALLAAAVVLLRGLRSRTAAPHLVTVALFAAAALPIYAFYQGHPFRIRYMIPIVAACALFCGVAVGMVARGLAQRADRRAVKARPTDRRPPLYDAAERRPPLYGPAERRPPLYGPAGRRPPLYGPAERRPPLYGPAGRRPALYGPAGRGPALYGPAIVAALLIAVSIVESPPFNAAAPLLEEAQWDLPRSRERRAVSACLARDYGGEKVMASMGSLAHYMQELSHDGFAIADFLHEGNGAIWELAMETGPAPHAGWMLVEEQAEGGDVLAQRMRGDAAFARTMVRVCEGGGVALYRRMRAR